METSEKPVVKNTSAGELELWEGMCYNPDSGEAFPGLINETDEAVTITVTPSGWFFDRAYLDTPIPRYMSPWEFGAEVSANRLCEMLLPYLNGGTCTVTYADPTKGAKFPQRLLLVTLGPYSTDTINAGLLAANICRNGSSQGSIDLILQSAAHEAMNEISNKATKDYQV